MFTSRETWPKRAVGGEAPLELRRSPPATCGDTAWPSTTIVAGSALAAGNERWSARKPCFDARSSGSVLIPAAPMFKREHGERGGEQERDPETEAQRRAAHHPPDDRAPEAALARRLVDVPAEHGHAQRVDAVAEELQHGRQQRQRGDHGDDADEDRAERRGCA